jgi:hypothetical protein
VFTRALHWSSIWARWIQSIPPHRISLWSISLLSSSLCLDLPSGLFKFLTASLYKLQVDSLVIFLVRRIPFSTSISWLRGEWNYFAIGIKLCRAYIVCSFKRVSSFAAREFESHVGCRCISAFSSGTRIALGLPPTKEESESDCATVPNPPQAQFLSSMGNWWWSTWKRRWTRKNVVFMTNFVTIDRHRCVYLNKANKRRSL